MEEVFVPIEGSVVINGKKRKVKVLVPTLSFKKKGEEVATIYSAEELACDQEILEELYKSKNSAIKVTFDPSDPTVAGSPAADTAAGLTKENASLKATNANLVAANDKLTKTNADLNAANAGLAKENDDLLAQNKTLENSNIDLDKTNDDLQRQIKALTEENKNLKAK